MAYGAAGGSAYNGGDAVSLTRDVTSATPGPGGLPDGAAGGIGFGGVLAFRQNTLCQCREAKLHGVSMVLACSYLLGMGAGNFGGGGGGGCAGPYNASYAGGGNFNGDAGVRAAESVVVLSPLPESFASLQMFSRWGLHAWMLCAGGRIWRGRIWRGHLRCWRRWALWTILLPPVQATMCTRSTSWCTGGGGWSGGAGGETGLSSDITNQRGLGGVSFISPAITEVCFVPASANFKFGGGNVVVFAPFPSGETMLAEPPTDSCRRAYFEVMQKLPASRVIIHSVLVAAPVLSSSAPPMSTSPPRSSTMAPTTTAGITK